MDRQTLECIQKSHYISMAGQQLVESRLPMKFNYPKSIKIDLYERIEKDKISRLALIFFDSREAQEWYDQVHQSDAPLNVHRRVSIFANVVFVITEGSKQITVYVDFITEFYNPKPLCVLQHTTSEKFTTTLKNRNFIIKFIGNSKVLLVIWNRLKCLLDSQISTDNIFHNLEVCQLQNLPDKMITQNWSLHQMKQ